MLVVIARITLQPQGVDAYLEAARRIIPTTRAEPGCHRYGFAVDIDEPNVVWVSEEWESLQALEEHLATPHITDFMERVGNLVVAMDAYKYEVSGKSGF